MRKIRNVLSLFDGICCGKLALERAGIAFDKYYSSEIDPTCIEIAERHHNIISLGDVEDWEDWDLQDIDLIIGGSPCQGFACQGTQLNFDDPRSKLFFTMIEILKHYKPKYFLLENVVMRKEWEDIITKYIGVEPVHLCSSLVSAQTRKRIYWANWDISIPKSANIHLMSILTENEALKNPASIVGRKINPLTGKREDFNPDIPYCQCIQVKKDNSKMGCLTTVGKDSVLTRLPSGRYPHAFTDYEKGVDWRYLTPIECERLQTVPDDYTKGYSDSKRKALMGNGWTVDMIAHILSCIP